MKKAQEKALAQATNANAQILLAMGVLGVALWNTARTMRYLKGVLPHDFSSKTPNTPEATREALENMVEEYSSKVN